VAAPLAGCRREKPAPAPEVASAPSVAESEARAALDDLRAAEAGDPARLADATQRVRAALRSLDGDAREAAHAEMISILGTSHETRDVPSL
jgi:hypothetical protein